MKTRVLFVCTHNAARSQMAEGLLRARYGDRYEAFSAGTVATRVNPFAVAVMQEQGIDLQGHTSKTIEAFAGQAMDVVVTVCDQARETCPWFPARQQNLHQSFPDPSAVQGSDEEKRLAFRRTRDALSAWIDATFGERDARYPIGRFAGPDTLTEAERQGHIDALAALPDELRTALDGLTDAQLDTPYRDGGWTVRQVVHHIPDSHLNAYVRFKLALTEHEPLIRTYEEHLWAEVPEARTAPPALSLALLDALHHRWATALRMLPASEFARSYRHPESGLTTIDRMLGLYVWHGRHHVAHITTLRKERGW
jgi:thioredoxin type arsenate reductase